MELSSYLKPGLPSFGGTVPSAPALNAQGDNGQGMPQSAFYGSRQNTSSVILGPDGAPYRTSGRFPKKGDDRTYTDFHNLNAYEKVLHTYLSSNGYADNSYLIFFPREDWYQERQKYSIRSAPAFRHIVDSMVNPVFESDAIRMSNSDLFDTFVENADNTGTKLQDLIQTAQIHARMLGVTFLVMDNLTDADKALTLADALNDRICPYIYEKMPHEVAPRNGWKVNNWGRLEWISFCDKKETIEDKEKKGFTSVRQYYRRWTKSDVTLYYEEMDKDDPKKVIEIEVETKEHGLNYLPVYPILDYARTNNLTNFPMPILADLANQSFILYNVESWIMLLDVYCFPILTLPNMDTQSMAISASNAIQVPNDAKFAPAFINGSTDCLKTLMMSADRLEDKIYKMANQQGVSGTKQPKQAVSGISKEWDFRASNSVLIKTATSSESTEMWCAKTFGDYVHSPVDYHVEYAKEYSESYSQARMDAALAILNGKSEPPQVLAKELWVETAKVFFDDDAERAMQITDEINSSYAQEIKDKQELAQAQLEQAKNPQQPEQDPAEAFKGAINKMLNPGQKKPPINKLAKNNKSLKAQA